MLSGVISTVIAIGMMSTLCIYYFATSLCYSPSRVGLKMDVGGVHSQICLMLNRVQPAGKRLLHQRHMRLDLGRPLWFRSSMAELNDIAWWLLEQERVLEGLDVVVLQVLVVGEALGALWSIDSILLKQCWLQRSSLGWKALGGIGRSRSWFWSIVTDIFCRLVCDSLLLRLLGSGQSWR